MSEDIERLLASLPKEARAVPSRHLSAATCQKWDYYLRQNPGNGHYEHVALYRDAHGQVQGAKVRDTGPDGTGKDFYVIGKISNLLYGRHLWSAGGKVCTVIEGEIDTMTMSQANAHQFPVVGIPTGAGNGAKVVAANLEFFNSFEKVVFGPDMDTVGREAAVEMAKQLPPGKAFIAKWPEKDPNEVVDKVGLAEGNKKLTWAVYSAEAYRPDGIVDARDLTARCLEEVANGIPWPWEFMTKWTFGRRYGEQYIMGAGTGVGKTDWENAVVVSTITGRTMYGVTYEPEAVALFTYEGGGSAQTKKALAGKISGKRFHIPREELALPWTLEELKATMAEMDGPIWSGGGRLFINDSKGSADWEIVKDRARYLRRAENVRHFFVDPISALTAGEEDERKMIDKIILEGAHLAAELESCVYMMSHLTQPKDGPTHGEGGEVREKQFRGSGAITMFSDFVFGLERDKRGDDPCKTTVRVIKDRFTGMSDGKTDTLYFDQLTGLLEVPVGKGIGV